MVTTAVCCCCCRCCVVTVICCLGIPEGHRPTSAAFKSLMSVPGSAVCSTITPSWFAKMNLSFNGPVPAPPATAAAVDAILKNGPSGSDTGDCSASPSTSASALQTASAQRCPPRERTAFCLGARSGRGQGRCFAGFAQKETSSVAAVGMYVREIPPRSCCTLRKFTSLWWCCCCWRWSCYCCFRCCFRYCCWCYCGRCCCGSTTSGQTKQQKVFVVVLFSLFIHPEKG